MSIKIYSNIKEKLSKQAVLNFVTAHPRLTAILTGLGISIVFSSVGRFAVHEALAATTATTTTITSMSTATTAASSLTDTSVGASTSFQLDYVDKTSISHVPGHVTNVAFGSKCDGCGAKDFAPGNEATFPGEAKDFSPGDLAKSPGDASNIAPGKELKK